MSVDPIKAQTLERNAGLMLIGAALLALIAANGPLAGGYRDLLHLTFGPEMPRLGRMSLHQWVADGLMAIFFLLVGLEVKREWYQGRLSTRPSLEKRQIQYGSGSCVCQVCGSFV